MEDVKLFDLSEESLYERKKFDEKDWDSTYKTINLANADDLFKTVETSTIKNLSKSIVCGGDGMIQTTYSTWVDITDIKKIPDIYLEVNYDNIEIIKPEIKINIVWRRKTFKLEEGHEAIEHKDRRLKIRLVNPLSIQQLMHAFEKHDYSKKMFDRYAYDADDVIDDRVTIFTVFIDLTFEANHIVPGNISLLKKTRWIEFITPLASKLFKEIREKYSVGMNFKKNIITIHKEYGVKSSEDFTYNFYNVMGKYTKIQKRMRLLAI